jgi:hypothetical protein
MRTTLSIDDDVLAAVHERARAERTTAGHVLSVLARQALTASGDPHEQDGFYGFHPFPRRGVVVTNDTVTAIRDDLGE